MFRELFGLPAHALIVHAAVVFIPLAALAAILYAVWPGVRKHIWWAVLGLGVLAPVTGWAARLSGGEYKKYWVGTGVTEGEFYDAIIKHESYGNVTALWATGLGVLMLVLVLYAVPWAGASPSKVVGLLTSVVTVVVAAVTLYYVIRTGDAGAHASHVEL